MTFQGNIQDLQAAEVVDTTGDKIGKVGQVYLTDDTQEPSWVTVNTGFFGTKETFIPLAEARYADGVITVPYEKSFVKDAPNVDEDGSISREEEDELYRYYGVNDSRGSYEDRRVAGDATTTGVAGAGVGAAGYDAARTDRDVVADRDLADRRDVADVDGKESITLHEERANVGVQQVETGKVRLRKHVVTETETIQVPVEREEVFIERVPANGAADGGTISEGEVEVTLHEERPVINKETVATETVNVDKRVVTDTENVTTETAREELDVEGAEGVVRDGREDLR
ncbi:PRC and DUF2382 domain-containing protein [Brachybacterium sp. JHP9]|uniref:PRC and DUF2382 domain-containing protein n=1 Tax=Brachybacterium equifaecis TaxID=2910770 RepID=A0ABT0QZQ8_9MICO|nr:PRC and DUF2382 domain-containing protein [Brachybacterium equifaecis]MCL6422678.1 PRC and DUF2382 domain-containing protein [Brachybacterium equifaecis]